uniref:Cytokine receptor common subunit beta N-terminal domain-containing protein n=1 Tax=Gopherus evgoodei TaxID=1825980 RepID=A0A8C4YPM6_9SAUR
MRIQLGWGQFTHSRLVPPSLPFPTMAPVCTSYYSSLPISMTHRQCCAFLPPAESLPMQSLRCYNDYTSQLTCTWQECTAARRFLNVTLYHEDNLNK